ncbi:Oxidoreductase [hydrothermal vent metagenome]|uniref:Oxidoreductase n=1 Tax=hydrothermal vent metagenome TaxID=652676 RepID=A0A3B0TE96_9ZZZZ
MSSMNLSYWEYKTWLSNIDFTIVGSGIVGLNCALRLRSKYPKAKILVLEKGVLPQGASTKNAGFACFGSISEILADLKHHTEEEVLQLVQKRWNGITLLRKNLGDKNIAFKQYGGHELFLKKHQELYHNCLDKLGYVNQLLDPIFNGKAFEIQKNSFNFNNIQESYITSVFEAQLDTGKMMATLLHLVQKNGITILNSVSVQDFTENKDALDVFTDQFEFQTKKLLIATNGFATQLINQEVKPARAQVLITKPIKNLPIRGTFHLDEGYYYFRNIENRILLGGGRNLNFKGEQTTSFGETDLIQNQLKKMLKEIILPQTVFEIDRKWSGIMGLGNQKQPIVKQISNHVYCGIRLGGMGVAIGSLVGNELADMI